MSYYAAAASSYIPIPIPIPPSSSLQQQRHTHTRRKSTKLWEFEDQLTTGSINNSVLLTTMTRTTGMSLTRSNESSVEPRVGISNNDGSVKLYDVPMRVGGFGGHGSGGEDEDEDGRAGNGLSTRRALRKVGEVQLGEPINHSLISPDGRMLLSVGDSRR
ncbi:hypothetical protein CPC08DRAFT_770720 [Agrocybe pediades]|nr:hypothetical protein CPC08DRAFT_770720 [Agrocybe pediades]